MFIITYPLPNSLFLFSSWWTALFQIIFLRRVIEYLNDFIFLKSLYLNKNSGVNILDSHLLQNVTEQEVNCFINFWRRVLWWDLNPMWFFSSEVVWFFSALMPEEFFTIQYPLCPYPGCIAMWIILSVFSPVFNMTFQLMDSILFFLL